MNQEPVEKGLEAFFQVYNERVRTNDVRSKDDERVVAEKNQVLQPVRALLRRLVDAQLIVQPHENYDRMVTARKLPARRFEVHEQESSPSWWPGMSLTFDDPGHVEIAVPNSVDKERMGVIVIRCATRHPEAHLFQVCFKSVDQACVALSRFLAASTVSIEVPRQSLPSRG